MSKSCLLCGVGGQGVVLASKLIARAALNKGFFVRTTETIGMAQRGGSVVSHVRMGEEIYSPLIPKGQADVIMAFEPGEAVRSLPYLKKGGVVVVSRKAVKPVTATLNAKPYDGTEMIAYLKEQAERLVIVDGDAICEAAGSAKVLNVALLGAAVKSGVLNLTLADMEKEIKKNVKSQFVEMNMQALMLGAEAAE